MIDTFHEKLEELKKDVIDMGNLVSNNVEDAINSILTGNPELARKVIKDDDKIDDYNAMIEEKCMYILALYQPVARDLRLIQSINIIVIYLERIGDISVNIAKLTIRLYEKDKKQLDKDILEIIIEMSNIVRSILDKALKAFSKEDSRLALKLDQMDSSITDLQKALYQKMYKTSVYHSEDYIKLVTNISLLSRYLERIGDNSVNIGDRVLYYLTGDFRHIHSDV